MIYVARGMGSKAGHGIVKVPKLVCQVLAPPAAAYYHWRHSSFLWFYCRHQFRLFILEFNLEKVENSLNVSFSTVLFMEGKCFTLSVPLWYTDSYMVVGLHKLVLTFAHLHQTLQNLQCIYTTCVYVYVTVDDNLRKSSIIRPWT